MVGQHTMASRQTLPSVPTLLIAATVPSTRRAAGASVLL